MIRSLTRLHSILFLFLLALLAGCQTLPHGLSASQIKALKEQGFTQNDEGWSYDLSGKVLFGSDLDSLNNESQTIVERIGRALLSVGIDSVRVDGHADASGKPAYNLQLSERRAQSVGNVLAGIGMQRHNIQTRGLGSSQPVADNSTSAGRTENRRVSIVVKST